MPNHQLAPTNYQFYVSCHERLMFGSETKIVAKIHGALGRIGIFYEPPVPLNTRNAEKEI